MAFLDNSLILSSAQAITVSAASTNLYDVTGAGSGNAPSLVWGTSTVFGADIGTGDGAARPTLLMNVDTAFVSGGGATLQVVIQAAVDNGSDAPGSYVDIYASKLFTAANLAAGKQLVVPIPPITIGQSLPRFYRVYYTVGTSTFSAGAVTTSILMTAPSGLINTLYPSNFTSV